MEQRELSFNPIDRIRKIHPEFAKKLLSAKSIFLLKADCTIDCRLFHAVTPCFP